VKYVIFDEIHYLDDVERGTVWEESIIFAPEHIRFVCLSATIRNLNEVADWMRSIRAEEVGVVEETIRPVPLHHFFFADGTVYKKLEHWPARRPKRRGRRGGGSRRRRGGHGERPESRLIQYIRERKQIPCLYFAFSRKRCEELAGAFKGMALLNRKERGKSSISTKVSWRTTIWRREGSWPQCALS